MEEYDLQNLIAKPTRIKENKTSDGFRLTKTLIDVCLHNSLENFGITSKSDVVECPFSDHSFICVSIGVRCEKVENKEVYGRNLNQEKVKRIVNEIKKENFGNALNFTES